MTAFSISGDLDSMPNSTRAMLAGMFGATTSTGSTGTPPSSGSTPPGTTDPSGGTTPTTSTTPTIAERFFPASAADAEFPSPENSRSLREGDTISGKPYLIDDEGTVYRLVPHITDTPDQVAAGRSDAGLMINGARRTHYLGTSIDLILMRQKKVYVQLNGGQWQRLTTGTGSLNNASLPDALEVDPTTGTTTKPTSSKIPRPVLKGKTPGSSDTVLLVGLDRPFATLEAAHEAAHDGDTIDINGTFTGPPPRIEKNLLIRSTTGATWNMQGVTSGWASGGKAVLVAYAEQVIFDGLTVLDAVGPDSGFGAFRADDQCRSMTVRNSTVKRCTNAIKGSGGSGCIIVSENNHFDGNGLGPDADSCHHIYAHHTDFFSEKGSTFLNCAGAHDIKVRGPEATIDGARLSAKRSSCIDICEGSQELVIVQNSTFHKDADAENHLLFSYAAETQVHGTAGALLLNNTYEAYCDNPLIQAMAGIVTLSGGPRYGNPITAEGGGKVLGL